MLDHLFARVRNEAQKYLNVGNSFTLFWLRLFLHSRIDLHVLGLVIFDLGGICFESCSIYLFIDEYLEDVKNQIKQTLLILAVKLAMHANGLEQLFSDDGDGL